MQIKFRISILTAVAAILLLASCSKTNEQGKRVPEDALVAVVVDGASLSEKLPWDELKQNILFKNALSDSNLPAFVKQALENPDNSGIDTKKDLIFYLVKDSSGGYGVFTGTLKTADKFHSLLLEIIKGGSEEEKEGIKTISKSPIIAGYDKESFVILVDIPSLKKSNFYNDEALATPRDLASTCFNIFKLNEKKSLGSNEKFTSLVKEKGDIHLWLNVEQIYKDIPSGGMGMFKMDKLYEGNVTTSTLNFENGKITSKSSHYSNKELAAVWKKYEGNSIDENMVKRIPAKDIAMVLAMNFKPEGIREILKVTGMDGMVTMATGLLGFNLDDFIKANKGDLLLALTDFKSPITDGLSIPNDSLDFEAVRENPTPDILFATSIGDKEAFNNLVKTIKKMGDKGIGTDKVKDVAYNLNDKYFAIGTSKENVDKFLAGGNTDYEFLKKMSGNPIAVYVNIQYIIKAFQFSVKNDNGAKSISDLSKKLFQDLYLTAGEYSNGALHTSLELNMVDKNTNSLKQLNQFFGTVAQYMIAEKKRKNEEESAIENFDGTIQTRTDTESEAPVFTPPVIKNNN